MLALQPPRSSVSRRDFLRLGGLGAVGLGLPTLLKAGTSPARARRCILLFLTGGPPHTDMWDMKPDAPDVIRGELAPIATTAPGLRISELFPRVARQAHHLCVVRSVTHADRTHHSAGYTMLTGVPHPLANSAVASNVRPTSNDHPHIGSLLSYVRPSRNGVPVSASLPEVIADAGVNVFPGQDGGFLGQPFAPFRIEANAERSDFLPPDLTLPADMPPPRLAGRQNLLAQLERGVRSLDPHVNSDTWRQRALDLLRAPGVRHALDLEREPAAVRERYGRHLFGQGCLMARRLVEADVGLVTVYWHYEGPDDSPVWDTHENNFPHLRRRLMPPTDMAFAALLDDLAARGLLADTLVVCMGEFGRSPRINPKGGREHWSSANSIVLAGAGVAPGIYGATDRDGGLPTDRPVSPADVTATLLHLLGVPADLEVRDRVGRPLRACDGTPITGILS